MSDSSYPLSFYVIQMGDNRYDLYNVSTDKCILKGKDTNTIKTFLDVNHPNHPFLSTVSDSYPEPISMGYGEKDIYPSGSYTYSLTDPSLVNKDTGDISNYSFYCASFDYSNSDYCSGLSDEEVGNNKKDSSQLEFDFTRSYKDSSNDSNNSPEDLEDNIPYLGDNED